MGADLRDYFAMIKPNLLCEVMHRLHLTHPQITTPHLCGYPLVLCQIPGTKFFCYSLQLF